MEKGGKVDSVQILPGEPVPDGRINLPKIGLARLKRDRWAAVEPEKETGLLQTRPMYWAGRELFINAAVKRASGNRKGGGSVRAELLDHTGKPITGFTKSESDPFTGDSLEHRMSWKGKKRLPVQIIGKAFKEGEPGRVLSIRFFLDRARLFSFSC